MKKALIVLIVVTVLFAVLADTQSKDSIVICSSQEQFRSDEMQAQLNERFPDKNIIVMYMATGKAAAKIYAEGPDTEVDILVGMETGYLNKIKDSLADISGASRIPYMEGVTVADNGGLWVTWERQAGAIVVNREILEKYGLDAPESLFDLLKPEYKALVTLCLPIGAFICLSFVKQYPIGLTLTLDNVRKLLASGIGIYFINSLAISLMIPQLESQSFIEGTAIVSLLILALNLLEKIIAFFLKRGLQTESAIIGQPEVQEY